MATKSIIRAFASGAVLLNGEKTKAAAATTKAPNYTPEQTSELREAWETVRNASEEEKKVFKESYAAKLGKSVRSIVAKLTKEGVYEKKVYTTKKGEKPQAKNAIADAIGAVLLLNENDIESLTKANKTALEKVFQALANSKPLDNGEARAVE